MAWFLQHYCNLSRSWFLRPISGFSHRHLPYFRNYYQPYRSVNNPGVFTPLPAINYDVPRHPYISADHCNYNSIHSRLYCSKQVRRQLLPFHPQTNAVSASEALFLRHCCNPPGFGSVTVVCVAIPSFTLFSNEFSTFFVCV